jgi:hypothetical protein
MSSGSKKKEPSYVYLSEAKASHSHRMWTEVSSSVPHFLQMELLLRPIIHRCLLKMLCPVSRPITTLYCVLLKDSNWAPAARLGPEINYPAHLFILQGPRHNTRFCFSIQHFIFLLIFCLETPKKGSGPTNHWTEPLLASLLVISFPRTPACKETQYSLTACQVEISFACWHCRTKGDILVAWSAFRAAWLSEQMHISLTDPEFQFHEHRLVLHILQTEACLPREILSLLFACCP